MRRLPIVVLLLLLPAMLAAQSSAARDSTDGVMLVYERFADIFGSRIVDAFDSIPAARYDFRPTPSQQTVGWIAQHLEDANYALCEQLGSAKRPGTPKDSLADSVRARWPKDTLTARLRASFRFCDAALDGVRQPLGAARTSTLLAFETDLAEHYSQLATYMRLLGLVPPSALPPRAHATVALPASALAPYVGRYQLARGVVLEVTLADGALFARSSLGGPAVRLDAESDVAFYSPQADARLTFERGAGGAVTGLVLNQFGRDRTAPRTR